MAKMLDLIRESAVPASLMRSAARGALALPAPEMLEILVHLAHHPTFGQQARLTLAEWDEASASAIASDPKTPKSVLEYMFAPENRRLTLIPALVDNPAVEERAIVQLAATASDELANAMLASKRVRSSVEVLAALKKDVALSPETSKVVDSAFAVLNGSKASTSQDDPLALEALAKFESEHKDEIAEESNKPFRIYVPEGEAKDDLAEQADKHVHAAHPAKADEPERVSTLQKIARLTVGERVQLAMKGTRDERFILIRDGSKVVSLAVLESPKLTDSEVEGFAAMKNVQEVVLRGIAGKRKFMKHYAVIKALANNPRTPLDVGLSMLPHLLAQDLKFLSMNKNVSDTVRKLATKLFKEKQSTRQG